MPNDTDGLSRDDIINELRYDYERVEPDEAVRILLGALDEARLVASAPVPMLIWCPMCRRRHIDAGEFATKHHHTHSCQTCGHCWRPAVVATVGVRFLPGFKDEEKPNA